MEKASTLYTDMHDAGGDDWVVAFHVCPSSKADDIKTNLTAGGVATAVATLGAPSESECVVQVATERAPWAPPTVAPRTVVEFGVGKAPDYKGRAGDVLAVFEIQAKNLRWGSASEGGWCAYPGTPIKWVRVDSV